jgi:uncharacterized SAM-binding protein YcdF (DUF218 family)
MMNTWLSIQWPWSIAVAVALGLFVAASVPPVRTMLSAPLVVSDGSASGDAAYVLADGNALWERLDAAADLYLMKRVPLLIVMRDNSESAFSFKAHASWTVTQWSLDFLQWRGVPAKDVLVFDSRTTTRLGTLNEARNLALVLPTGIARLVLVTSPAHTRRSVLAFTRSFRTRVAIVPYAATPVDQSAEYYSPLWLEYLKLLAYAIVA